MGIEEAICTWALTFTMKEKWEFGEDLNRQNFIYLFLGPRLWHVEAPRLGIELELHLLAYTTATAMPDLSHVCGLHHNSWQCQILNPVSKARDRTCVLMDASQICFR